MREFDEHSGHAGRTDVTREVGFVVFANHIAPSLDRPTLVTEGVDIEFVQETENYSGHAGRTDDAEEVVIERMQRIDEHSGHAGRTYVVGVDGFIGINNYIASFINWKRLFT